MMRAPVAAQPSVETVQPTGEAGKRAAIQLGDGRLQGRSSVDGPGEYPEPAAPERSRWDVGVGMVRHTGGQDHRNEAGRISGSSGGRALRPLSRRRVETKTKRGASKRRNENRPPA